jgi:DNA helicase-2/ATP-dependent DNA helicase PcrA
VTVRADILVGLNDAQREAVVHPGGPLLVLAGAGSGKTRVITQRIAHLVLECGVPPSAIVAVTFTNKAAGEMRARVEELLARRQLGAWVGTFHALCLRILRRDGVRVGLAPGFNVYDSDDQQALVKRILKDEGIDEGSGSARSYLSRISRAKNDLRSPEELERQLGHERKLVAQVWRAYDAALRRANAVDFDDLLLRTLALFDADPALAASYASRCEHLLVDEYQDTNRPQYLLVRALSRVHGNVCVVGDEDQCIYRFRGAELRNILEFEADHPGARVVRLERNYRSTATILEAASAVVARNRRRKGKTLWTTNPAGQPIELWRSGDDRAEAAWIARRVGELQAEHTLEQMAVLYRTNAQSRLVEEAFRTAGLPYQVVGAVQFYARKEIKDLLAYLRLAANPTDDVSFRRVLNTPPRGIGATSEAAIEQVARETGLPLLEAAGHALEQGRLATRAARMLQTFLDLYAELARRSDDHGVAALLEWLVTATEFERHLHRAYAGLGAERMDNVRGLISAAAEYAEDSGDGTLQGFLDRSALVADADEVGQRPGVTLMTIHCAKGLEFPVVFLAGLEETLFPHVMASGSDDDLEEERRLCYVAMTRARERLLLSHALLRRVQGEPTPRRASRFLEEVPPALLHEVAPRSTGFAFAADAAWGAGGGSSAARAAARRRPAVSTPSIASSSMARQRFEDGFDVGAFVRHPRFGPGRIVDREGHGPRLKLTIDFPDHGPKKILPAYTRLQIEL